MTKRLIDRRAKLVRDEAMENDFRDWLTKQLPDEEFNANLAVSTAFCRFLRASGRAQEPRQHGFYWWEEADFEAHKEGQRVPTLIEAAQNSGSYYPGSHMMTFGETLSQFDRAVKELGVAS